MYTVLIVMECMLMEKKLAFHGLFIYGVIDDLYQKIMFLKIVIVQEEES